MLIASTILEDSHECGSSLIYVLPKVDVFVTITRKTCKKKHKVEELLRLVA
jgi:hypothetical protein